MNIAGGIIGLAIAMLLIGGFGIIAAVSMAIVDTKMPAWGYLMFALVTTGSILIGLFGNAVGI